MNPLTLDLIHDGITRRWCFSLDVAQQKNAMLTDPFFGDGDLSDVVTIGEWIECDVNEQVKAAKIEKMDIVQVSLWQIAEGLAYKFVSSVAAGCMPKEVLYYFSEQKGAVVEDFDEARERLEREAEDRREHKETQDARDWERGLERM
mgnify:CR=1 FL=1